MIIIVDPDVCKIASNRTYRKNIKYENMLILKPIFMFFFFLHLNLNLQVKKWEEDDFYASDEDEFLDRTGNIEKKRKVRMKIAGKAQDVVETYDSLMKKHEENKILLEKFEAELKEAMVRKEKAERRSQNNDLDNYLAELKKGAQIDKETIQKLKMRIMTLNQEQERLTKLINIARPASMPELKVAPKLDKFKVSGVMIGKRGSKGLHGKLKSVAQDVKAPAIVHSTDTKVLEAFLNETEFIKPKRSKLDDEDEEDEIKPIGYEVKPEAKPKERIGYIAMSKPTRVLGPQVPSDLRNIAPDPELDTEKETSLGADPKTEERLDSSAVSESMDFQQSETNEEFESGADKKKRGDRGSKRRRKPGDEDEEEEEEEYYKVGMDRKYDVWVPPSNQSGDGRTCLNDKLGY